jgi:small-conductance mechanosensitive channel
MIVPPISDYFSGPNTLITMLNRFIIGCIVIVAIAGCNQREKEAWKRETDSLRTQLALNAEAVQTLGEVGALIDSIDASRDVLRSGIAEGLPHDSFVARLGEINDYVKATQVNIEDLDNALRKSKSANANVNAVVAKLKKDLKAKSDELLILSAEVGRYKLLTDSLSSTVDIQSAELNDKLEQLTARQNEITRLEEEMMVIAAQAKYDMAESYYLRAQALEEAAKRTNFAPKKKKNTRNEALELYKLAALSGKQEAEVKVQELENR